MIATSVENGQDASFSTILASKNTARLSLKRVLYLHSEFDSQEGFLAANFNVNYIESGSQ